AARGDRLRDQLVHLAAVLTGKRNQHLRALRGITDGIGSELLELGVGQQHDVGALAHDHACPRVVGELGIETKAEFFEELHGPDEVGYREIYEYFGAHAWLRWGW